MYHCPFAVQAPETRLQLQSSLLLPIVGLESIEKARRNNSCTQSYASYLPMIISPIMVSYNLSCPPLPLCLSFSSRVCLMVNTRNELQVRMERYSTISRWRWPMVCSSRVYDTIEWLRTPLSTNYTYSTESRSSSCTGYLSCTLLS